MDDRKVDFKRSDREAIKRYNMGLRLGASTDISESPSYGYGELDSNGFWEFPLYFEEAHQNVVEPIRSIINNFSGN